MATRYLLDSNVLVAALKGEPPSLLSRLAGLSTDRLCLSSIVLGELLTGAEKSREAARNKADVARLIHGMEILTFGTDDAAAYARIRAALQKKGTPIGPLDNLIAAQAVTRGLVVVTANLGEFSRVPDLSSENWLK